MNFRDNFRTVWDEFSGLLLDSLDRIFGTIFRQFGTDFRTLCVLFFVCYCKIKKNLNNMLVV